jgi:predicted O-methyltransferase YrrM
MRTAGGRVASRSPLHTVKRAYATTAQAAGRGLTRLGILGEGPPPLERRVRHWAYSLTKVHDSLALAALDVPWWTYGAIAAVMSWFADRSGRPTRVFEYGSGASTLWLARRASEVHSVEHHRGFGDMMAAELRQFDHVTLRIVEPAVSEHPVVASAKEGHQGLDFAEYVAAINSVPGDFDLVVVDGRAREACLSAAQCRLAPGGIVVFDNSRRRRYREAIRASGMLERRFPGLTPTLPYPEQTSILQVR